MAILQIQMDFAGRAGVNPRTGSILTNDNLAAVTTVNWLKPSTLLGYTFYSTDFIAVAYSGGSGWFSPTIDSNGNITLVAKDAPNGVTVSGSVTPGNWTQFSGANSISDVGFKIVHGISAIWGGGSATHTFAAPGVIAFCEIIADIRTYTTAASAVLSANSSANDTIDVVFNQDPGLNTSINWVAFI